MLPEFEIIELKQPNFVNDSPILANSKNINFMAVGKPNFRGAQVEHRAKTGKLRDFPEISRANFPICS